jgi:hypothetical protein
MGIHHVKILQALYLLGFFFNVTYVLLMNNHNLLIVFAEYLLSMESMQNNMFTIPPTLSLDETCSFRVFCLEEMHKDMGNILFYN